MILNPATRSKTLNEPRFYEELYSTGKEHYIRVVPIDRPIRLIGIGINFVYPYEPIQMTLPTL